MLSLLWVVGPLIGAILLFPLINGRGISNMGCGFYLKFMNWFGGIKLGNILFSYPGLLWAKFENL